MEPQGHASQMQPAQLTLVQFISDLEADILRKESSSGWGTENLIWQRSNVRGKVEEVSGKLPQSDFTRTAGQRWPSLWFAH